MAATQKTQVNGTSVQADDRRPMTIPDFMEAKARGVRLTLLTAYDYTMARIVDEAGIDIILVGDSIGNTMLGYGNTVPVTLDEIVMHTRAECVTPG